jgi:hypothetical protein
MKIMKTVKHMKEGLAHIPDVAAACGGPAVCDDSDRQDRSRGI